MANKLKQKEIKKRLTRLRNLEMLYKKARAIIDPLKKEIRLLKKENKLLKEENAILKSLFTDQQLRIEELEKMVFGHKKDKGDKSEKKEQSVKKSKRKKSSYRRPKPSIDEITDREKYPINNCPECGEILTKKKKYTRYIEDMILPTPGKFLKTVAEAIIESGYCTKCKKRYSAIPISKQEVIVGDNLRKFATYATVVLRLSYEQTKNLIKGLSGLEISDGEIVEILSKEAGFLSNEYNEMKGRIRGQPGVHYDETTWKVRNEEQGKYAWVMTGTQSPEAIFWLGRSRGKGNAENLRGDGKHIGITDAYAAYMKLFKLHQLCWAHPNRKLRDLKDSDKLSKDIRNHCIKMHREFGKIYKEVRETIKTDFKLEERESIIDRLKSQLLSFTKIEEFEPTKLKNIKNHLKRYIDKYFTCLLHEGIPCDNNKAERTIRHLVIKRLISLGSQTQKMAEVMSILYSVLLSTWWKHPDQFFVKYSELRIHS